MAVGISGTNPELVINVTYDTTQASQNFDKTTKKIEQDALKHEAKLKQIAEKGALQTVIVKQNANVKYETAEKVHQDKIRRMREVAQQKILIQQEAYQQKMLRSQSSWSARMVRGVESITKSLKLFAAAYLAMLIKNSIGGAFNYVDDILKTADALDISTDRLQVYQHALSLANINAEKTTKIFEKIALALSDASNGDVKKINILNTLGIGPNDDPGSALEKILNKAKTGIIDLTGLSVIFGDKLAGQIKRIADSNVDFEAVRDELGKNLITSEQIKEIEEYNDKVETLTNSIKIGFARALSSSAGEGSTVLDKWSKAIGETNWEAVGDGILFIVKAFEALGKSLESVAKATKVLLVGGNFFSETIKVQQGVLSVATAYAEEEMIITNLIKTLETSKDIHAANVKAQMDAIRGSRSLKEAMAELKPVIEAGSKVTEEYGKDIKILQEDLVKASTKYNTSIDDILKGTNKFQRFIAQIINNIKLFWPVLREGGTVFGVVGKYFATFIEWGGKVIKVIANILKPLSSVFKMIGKISVILTAIFVIYDFVSALTKGLNVLEATLYTVLKFLTDVIDGLWWILSLGGSLGATDLMESWGMWGGAFVEDTDAIKKNLEDISKFKPINTYDPKYNPGKFDTPPVTTGNAPKSFAEELAEQIKDQEKLRAETLKHINLLEDYADKYKDNADVMKVVNDQLKEQSEILADLNRNKVILNYQTIGVIGEAKVAPFELPNMQELKDKMKEMLPAEIFEVPKNKYMELMDELNNRANIRVAIDEWEVLKNSFVGNSEAIALIDSKIQELNESLTNSTGFEKLVSDFAEWYATWNQVVGETFDFFQDYFDGITQAYNNQIEVLQEVIRLENERWDSANARMDESGIKNTAYYFAQKKAHEKYIKDLEKREYELKGKAWDADKDSKIAQTIMNTAQGIMAAWSAGPIVGAIMSAIVAATGALQLATITNQQNPYRRNSGGWIPGTTYTDSVSTMLTPGEFVVNRNAARENAQLLEKVNSGSNIEGGTTNIYVTIDGTIVGQDSWIEQELIPGISKAINKGYEL